MAAPLQIVSQPAHEFFKDEGGSSHTLQVTVASPAGCAPPAVPLKLHFALLLAATKEPVADQ
jgi:hypothetical protein